MGTRTWLGISSNAFKIGEQLQLGDKWSRSNRQETQTVNPLGFCLPSGVCDGSGGSLYYQDKQTVTHAQQWGMGGGVPGLSVARAWVTA